MKNILLIVLVFVFSQASAKNFISEKHNFGFKQSSLKTEISSWNLSQGLCNNFNSSKTNFRNNVLISSSEFDFHIDEINSFKHSLNSENKNPPTHKYALLSFGDSEITAYNFNQKDLKKDPVWPDFLMFGIGFGFGSLGAATSGKDDSPFLMGMLGGGIVLAAWWLILEK